MEYFIFLMGLIIGSFLNVCIYRIPKGDSIIYPSSHCMNCNTTLKPWDLIPFLSYFFYRGKCRYCGTKISIQYPFIELLNGLIYLFLYYKFGYSLRFIQYGILSSLLIVISMIDLKYQIIPNRLIILGFISSFLFQLPLFIKDISLLVKSITGLLLGGGIFLLISIITKGAMGGGDIKLMGVLGFWLGWKWILFVMFLSFFLGAIISILLLLLKIKGRKDMIPFGPFIGIATLMTVFYGNDIIYYYLMYLLN